MGDSPFGEMYFAQRRKGAKKYRWLRHLRFHAGRNPVHPGNPENLPVPARAGLSPG